MKTAIVILNYNDYENTQRYIKEIENYEVLNKILIVDNCSPKNDYERLKKFESEKIEVIKTEKNGGYSYGNNFALKYLENTQEEYEYIIISNTDISVDEIAIYKCVQFLKENNNAAIAAPRMFYTNGEARRASWKKRTYIRDLVHSSRILELLFYSVLRSGEYTKKDYENRILKVDCISGAFFVAKAKILKTIDYFDENVFLFYEEDILSSKIEKHGYEIYSINDVSFTHYESQAIGKVMNQYRKLKTLDKSKLYFQEKYNHISKIQVILLKIILLWRKVELVPEVILKKIVQILKKSKKTAKMIVFFVI